MADIFRNKLEQIEEAVCEYKKALETFSDMPNERIYCLQKLASCKIELGMRKYVILI